MEGRHLQRYRTYHHCSCIRYHCYGFTTFSLINFSMKKIILIISIFFAGVSSFSFLYAGNCSFDVSKDAEVFLQECSQDSKKAIKPYLAGDTESSIKERVKIIANGAISLGALLAVGALVWAGIQYTKAYGEEESIKKAKTTGIYALIGLILLLSSFGLVNILINFIYNFAG